METGWICLDANEAAARVAYALILYRIRLPGGREPIDGRFLVRFDRI